MKLRYYGLVSVVVVIILFFMLQNNLENKAEDFSDEFEKNMLNGLLEKDQFEFDIQVPVPILSVEGNNNEIIVRYWALGGLIDGTKSFSIEDERFDSIDVGGLYLPQKYTIVVNIENEILLVDFEPTF
ncbi:MAG: hypothetical protein VX368_02250 [Thermoproteota archaeon]